jgi:hypothetical protein
LNSVFSVTGVQFECRSQARLKKAMICERLWHEAGDDASKQQFCELEHGFLHQCEMRKRKLTDYEPQLETVCVIDTFGFRQRVKAPTAPGL